MLVLRSASIFDSVTGRVIDKGYVVVDGKRIAEVGEGDPRGVNGTIIDLNGKFVLPGLINAHVHLVWDGSPDPDSVIRSLSYSQTALLAAAMARRHLHAGITTVRDVGSVGDSVLALRWAVENGLVEGPNIVASGPPLTMTGGHMHPVVGQEVDGEAEVLKATRALIKRGVDLIKVMATGGVYTPHEKPGSPQLSVREITVAVEEAHKRGIPVSAHAEGLEGVRNAVSAGVDSIEHGNFADRAVLLEMKAKGIVLVPTASWFWRAAQSDAVLMGIPPYVVEKVGEVVDAQRQSLGAALDLEIEIATGTDAGAPIHPPENFFMEIDILKEFGMSPTQVLQAATWNGARVCRRDDIGRLVPGALADILVVQENPIENLSSLRRTELVIKSGRIVRGGEQS